MGQKNLKGYRRALHRTAQEEKNNIVSRYMTDNWDKVVVSTVSLIRQFNFKNRFSIAMTILFKPMKKLSKDQKGSNTSIASMEDKKILPRPEVSAAEQA